MLLPNNSPDCVKTRASGAPAPRMALREARSGVEVGTRFAILGFSHSLSLQLTRRAGAKVRPSRSAGPV
jgi:hypothetical protein